MTVVDAQRILERRLRAGLSRSQLAATIGVTHNALRELEAGRLGEQWTLGQLDRLATALNMAVTDLIAERAESAPSGDAQQLEALMLAHREPMTIRRIASVMGWTAKRALTASDQLQQVLADGPAVVRSEDRALRLAANPEYLKPHQLRRLNELVDDRALKASHATVLELVIGGSLPANWEDQLEPDERRALADLLGQGHIIRRHGQFQPSDDLIEALGLRHYETSAARGPAT